MSSSSSPSPPPYSPPSPPDLPFHPRHSSTLIPPTPSNTNHSDPPNTIVNPFSPDPSGPALESSAIMHTSHSSTSLPFPTSRSMISSTSTSSSSSQSTAPTTPGFISPRAWRHTPNVPTHFRRRHLSSRAGDEHRWLSEDEGIGGFTQPLAGRRRRRSSTRSPPTHPGQTVDDPGGPTQSISAHQATPHHPAPPAVSQIENSSHKLSPMSDHALNPPREAGPSKITSFPQSRPLRRAVSQELLAAQRGRTGNAGTAENVVEVGMDSPPRIRDLLPRGSIHSQSGSILGDKDRRGSVGTSGGARAQSNEHGVSDSLGMIDINVSQSSEGVSRDEAGNREEMGMLGDVGVTDHVDGDEKKRKDLVESLRKILTW
ncbi:hypothetical protein M231_03776 [Tremella mesenterica]|uniref:Uncharacterized protein n=1 Tax=Tremella mesenterica TaxID=5217 RepID=A0A4Q1BM82_TREME|nr:hypothetical protein M231_03776 [Tremella mesenterica]